MFRLDDLKAEIARLESQLTEARRRPSAAPPATVNSSGGI
jgi:hypothetical protein